MNYYARSALKGYIKDIAGWIRRRLRQKLWKLWKEMLEYQIKQILETEELI